MMTNLGSINSGVYLIAKDVDPKLTGDDTANTYPIGTLKNWRFFIGDPNIS